MYIPDNHRLDPYEARHGPEHMIYEWRGGDERLAEHWERWRVMCYASDAKRTIMVAMHSKAIGLTNVWPQCCRSWSAIGVDLLPSWRPIKPVAVFRVQLVQGWSQYLGYLLLEDIEKIQPVNVSPRPGGPLMMRRPILEHHLRKGMPDG